MKKRVKTGESASTSDASGAMALMPIASAGTTLPDRFPWLSAFSRSVPAHSVVDLGDELALFADEVFEWAEESLAVGLEACQDDDDDWSDL